MTFRIWIVLWCTAYAAFLCSCSPAAPDFTEQQDTESHIDDTADEDTGHGGETDSGTESERQDADSDSSRDTAGDTGTDSFDAPPDTDTMTDTETEVAPWAPCPPLPELCRIMASGDSITVGAQSTDTGGYRVSLFHLALENQRQMTFVGPSGAGPDMVDGVLFPEAHDGHNGYVIDTFDTRKGLLPLMEQNLADFQPHIVLLMIGSNDINSNLDLANAPTRMAALLDLIGESAPETFLVVAALIPTREDELDAAIEVFNRALEDLVAERQKEGRHILMVNMYSAFRANPSWRTDWLFDGLHPNDAGYAVMADVWYEAISGFLR